MKMDGSMILQDEFEGERDAKDGSKLMRYPGRDHRLGAMNFHLKKG